MNSTYSSCTRRWQQQMMCRGQSAITAPLNWIKLWIFRIKPNHHHYRIYSHHCRTKIDLIYTYKTDRKGSSDQVHLTASCPGNVAVIWFIWLRVANDMFQWSGSSDCVLPTICSSDQVHLTASCPGIMCTTCAQMTETISGLHLLKYTALRDTLWSQKKRETLISLKWTAHECVTAQNFILTLLTEISFYTLKRIIDT